MQTITFIYTVIVVYTIFTLAIMLKALFVGTKIWARLESLRGKKIVLWPSLIFSILFLFSYFSIFSVFFGAVHGPEFIAKSNLEAKMVYSWLGDFSYDQVNTMFIFILLGIPGLKAIPLIIEIIKKLLNTSLVLTPRGELRPKEEL